MSDDREAIESRLAWLEEAREQIDKVVAGLEHFDDQESSRKYRELAAEILNAIQLERAKLDAMVAPLSEIP